MLSKDEINDGRTFILKLWDDTGAPAQWIEELQGATARLRRKAFAARGIGAFTFTPK